MSTITQVNYPASKFRSAASAKILRAVATGKCTDTSLSEWTALAVADLLPYIDLKGSKNGHALRTWYAAKSAVRDGVDLFADVFYPECATFIGRFKYDNDAQKKAYWAFKRNRLQDIIDMAEMEKKIYTEMVRTCTHDLYE